jgi:hypothetical protein
MNDFLVCHDRPVEVVEKRVISNDGIQYNYFSEFVLEGNCSVCGNLFIIHFWEAYNGKFYLEMKNQKAEKFKKRIRHKEDRFQEQHVDRRGYLYYREYGKKADGNRKKCHSNLNTVKLGLIDPDQGLNKDFYAA